MFRFLQSVFLASNGEHSPGVTDELLERATERLVEGTDPRIRAVSAYRRKLKRAVSRTVDYCIALVDDLPAPTALSSAGFGHDPILRMLFASPASAADMANAAPPVRRFLNEHRVLPEHGAFAMLLANPQEKQTLGMDLQGDSVRREVAQTVMTFVGHRMLEPAADEESARWALKKRAFDEFASLALGRLIAAKSEKAQLSREHALLKRKLSEICSACPGFFAPQSESERQDLESLQRAEQRIAEIESELKSLETDVGTLDAQLAVIADTLSAPEAHLWKLPAALTLDHMNVVRQPGTGPNVNTVSFNEYHASDGRRAAGLFVNIPKTILASAPDLISEARRRLS